MDLGKYFNTETLLPLALPVGIGILVLAVTIILRRFLYRSLHRMAAKTRTCMDDILIRDTRIVSLLWCIWLAGYTGLRLARTPESWADVIRQDLLVIFVALGIYTAIVIVVALLRWYRNEVCPKTKGNLDDIIITVLIYGIPIIGAALGIILILDMLGYSNPAVNSWLAGHGARLALLAIIGIVLLLSSIVIIPRIIETAVRNSKAEQTEEELKKRAETLSSVLTTTFQVFIILIIFFMVLSELGINIAPVLASAGVVGVALGFGAQSLVKDVLAGLFIIMENQYRKGDVVKIADVSGVVEDINLRRTILRDLDGITHVVPNGEIRVASNFTKQWARANINVSVSYNTDLEKAMAVINRVGKEMADDPVWGQLLLSPPRALRVDKLGDSGIEIKVIGETKPIRQWDVMGELRLRIKKAFDQEGIEIPWPHTKVYFGNQPLIIRSDVAGGESKGNPQAGSGGTPSAKN